MTAVVWLVLKYLIQSVGLISFALACLNTDNVYADT